MTTSATQQVGVPAWRYLMLCDRRARQAAWRAVGGLALESCAWRLLAHNLVKAVVTLGAAFLGFAAVVYLVLCLATSSSIASAPIEVAQAALAIARLCTCVFAVWAIATCRLMPLAPFFQTWRKAHSDSWGDAMRRIERRIRQSAPTCVNATPIN